MRRSAAEKMEITRSAAKSEDTRRIDLRGSGHSRASISVTFVSSRSKTTLGLAMRITQVLARVTTADLSSLAMQLDKRLCGEQMV